MAEIGIEKPNVKKNFGGLNRVLNLNATTGDFRRYKFNGYRRRPSPKKCYRCGKAGHIQIFCWKLQRYRRTRNCNQSANYISAINIEEDENHNSYKQRDFIMDNATKNHVCNEKSIFQNFRELTGVVHLPEGTIQIKGKGDVLLNVIIGNFIIDFWLKEVLYAPNLPKNVISMNRLKYENYETLIGQRTMKVNFPDGKRFLKIRMLDSTYILKAYVNIKNVNVNHVRYNAIKNDRVYMYNSKLNDRNVFVKREDKNNFRNNYSRYSNENLRSNKVNKLEAKCKFKESLEFRNVKAFHVNESKNVKPRSFFDNEKLKVRNFNLNKTKNKNYRNYDNRQSFYNFSESKWKNDNSRNYMIFENKNECVKRQNLSRAKILVNKNFYDRNLKSLNDKCKFNERLKPKNVNSVGEEINAYYINDKVGRKLFNTRIFVNKNVGNTDFSCDDNCNYKFCIGKSIKTKNICSNSCETVDSGMLDKNEVSNNLFVEPVFSDIKNLINEEIEVKIIENLNHGDNFDNENSPEKRDEKLSIGDDSEKADVEIEDFDALNKSLEKSDCKINCVEETSDNKNPVESIETDKISVGMIFESDLDSKLSDKTETENPGNFVENNNIGGEVKVLKGIKGKDLKNLKVKFEDFEDRKFKEIIELRKIFTEENHADLAHIDKVRESKNLKDEEMDDELADLIEDTYQGFHKKIRELREKSANEYKEYEEFKKFLDEKKEKKKQNKKNKRKK